MSITVQYINSLLVAEDIEGLIALGAPSDEYETEAQMIADAIAALSPEQCNEENIVAIIALAWATFELSSGELELRLPHIRNVARQIMHKHENV